MKIIVLVKQVPDTSEIKFDEKRGTMIRAGVPSILNPFDQLAVEEAVKIKNKVGGTVTVITLGPDQAKSALMRCLALGADAAIHLSDYAFAGADTLATAVSLATAIKKLNSFDLIMAGQMAQDGETGQVGPGVAALLDIPQVTYVESIKELTSNRVVVKSVTDDGYRIVEVTLPALLAWFPPASFEYANPTMSGIIRAKSKPYTVWKAKDISDDITKFGLRGSPTRVKKMFTPQRKSRGKIFSENIEAAAKEIIDALVKNEVISCD